MSEPRVGDVWIVDGEAHVCYDVPNQNEVVVGTVTRWTSTMPRARKCVWPRDELDPAEFNLFDLLSGDPAAWQAALRFAPKTGARGFNEALEAAHVEHRVDLCQPETAMRLALAAAGWARGLVEERAALENEDSEQ